jgi:NAD(P)H-dependent FMN reductase
MIENLRPIMENFGAMTVRETIMIGPVQSYFDDSGKMINPELDKKIEGLLKSLIWWAEALKIARELK